MAEYLVAHPLRDIRIDGLPSDLSCVATLCQVGVLNSLNVKLIWRPRDDVLMNIYCNFAEMLAVIVN